MQLDRLHLERELLQVNFDTHNLDIFADRKFAEAYYRKLGNIVLSGSDFENNMIFFLKDRFSYLDPYLKVKLGRARRSTMVADYGNLVMEYLTEKEVMLLLYLCRLCSYLGGPGFPELIVVNPQTRRWSLILVSEEIPAECAAFILMARLFEIEIKAANISRRGVGDVIEIDIKSVLEHATKTERFKNFINSLEDEAYKINNQAKGDEKIFLEEQINKTPFFLIKKWVAEGNAEKHDLLNAYYNFDQANKRMKSTVDEIIAETRINEEYKSIGAGRDEETLKKKFSWLLAKFSISEGRAKELLGMLP